MTEPTALVALFGTAFLSATILPLPSEGALIAFERAFPNNMVMAVMVATAGNTLGGLSTYLLGRFSRSFLDKKGNTAPQVSLYANAALKRYGPISLLLSWLPLVGDVMCGLAGWMKLSWWQCLLWMAAGKAARYAVVAGVFAKLTA
jgi:membrane protein YqaA with SNARE-associated domain